MSAPDPVTTGLVVAATLQIAKQAQDFIAAASGHPGESIGTIVGNWNRERVKNVEAVGNKARLILLNLDIEPRAVPLKVIHPLLEGASLEVDASLQDTWANLLANAADPRSDRNPVEPSFPGMLKELSSREVRFLHALLKEANGLNDLVFSKWELVNVFVGAGLAPPTYQLPSQWDFQHTEERPAEFRLMIHILLKQEILAARQEFESIGPSQIQEASESSYHPRPIEIPVTEYFILTQLGTAFVRMCQPPKA